jgi:putative transposase
VDFVRRWSEKTEIGAGQFIGWLDIAASKFYDWRERYGKVNEHNGWVPRDFWREDWEKQAIVGFHLKNPLEAYRRLAFMMLDADIVAVSPTSVWRVLGPAGLLSKWNGKPSKKGTGFEQPLTAHQHWHIDVSYINISGTFYYLCTILDGCSRYIVNGDLRESMTEADIEIILERAKELYPEAKPRMISDNGPQFIAKDFKEFIRISGMTHVRTSPYYPQSNGKIERWHKSLKSECIRPGTPLSLDDARRLGIVAAILFGAAFTQPAKADATFDFSFSNTFGNVNGTVNGYIVLPDVCSGCTASLVELTSFPAALDNTFGGSPFDVNTTFTNIISDTFTVSAGAVTAADFDATSAGGKAG